MDTPDSEGLAPWLRVEGVCGLGMGPVDQNSHAGYRKMLRGICKGEVTPSRCSCGDSAASRCWLVPIDHPVHLKFSHSVKGLNITLEASVRQLSPLQPAQPLSLLTAPMRILCCHVQNRVGVHQQHKPRQRSRCPYLRLLIWDFGTREFL